MSSRRFKNYGFIVLLLGFGLFFILWRNYANSNTVTLQKFLSPLAEEIHVNMENSLLRVSKSKDPTHLLTQIKQLVETQKGSYSVYIYDLQTNKSFGLNETAIFTAASVNKIYILATLYSEAKIGKVDLDTDITIQAKDIQNYGTGVIRYQGAGQIYSLKTLAQLMIEKSDNTAAFVLTNYVGETRIQELVESWGMIQTDMAMNKTSNKDVAAMLLKMYRGEIADKGHTAEMIGFMDDSDFENRLPRELPQEATVYHKIGTEVGNIHDVGIVEYGSKTYYIGVMTNDISDETATEKTIADVSKLTFDFMTN